VGITQCGAGGTADTTTAGSSLRRSTMDAASATVVGRVVRVRRLAGVAADSTPTLRRSKRVRVRCLMGVAADAAAGSGGCLLRSQRVRVRCLARGGRVEAEQPVSASEPLRVNMEDDWLRTRQRASGLLRTPVVVLGRAADCGRAAD